MSQFDRDAIAAALKAKGIPRKDFGEALGLDQQKTSKYFAYTRELKHDETLRAMDFLRTHGIALPAGFSETTMTPWAPATPDERATAAHLGTGARHPMHWTLDHSAPAFALLAGDVIVADSGGTATDGDIVAARRVDGETADFAVTFIARKIGQHLITGAIDAGGTILPLDSNTVSLIGPVVGSFRRRA